MTAVSFVTRGASGGAVTGLRAVRRSPAAGGGGAWAANTSEQLADWYDAAPSARFDKEVLDIAIAPFGVLIEATEFGDCLATSGVGFAQGIEVPSEDSRGYLSSCGQGTTIPFFVTYGREPAPSPDPWPAGSRGGGSPFSQQGMSWQRDWTYRRVDAARDSDPNAAAPGETSVINVGGGDDYDSGYVFYAINSSELNAQLAAPGLWRGGVNLTAYALAEQRSFGFYHYFVANATASVSGFLGLNASLAGTQTGLAKMPYLRDTRRSAGGVPRSFRVFKNNLTQPGNWSKAAVAWPDAIGIGQYFYADVHKMDAAVCSYPSYIDAGSPVLPYYIPFRALTVDGAPNMLVAGKLMATSFFANAAMRLHPEEWVSGEAAGVAAALMVANKWGTTLVAYENIAVVQQALLERGAPLNWTTI